jgi:hypothetical protein
MTDTLGLVALMGSGETSAAGGQVFEAVASRLAAPLTISVVETPAGFELNSGRVAGKVADYLQVRLQNFLTQVRLVAARRRGTAFSPEAWPVVEPMLDSQMVFMGPGSPSYAVRQLQGSLAWDAIRYLHRTGTAFVLASAATISIGCCALPVYEIYKVGEDPHWKPGLDFFGAFGLSLAFIPHWNNRDGGDEVDTSHCFIGAERFASLLRDLPQGTRIVGLDEHTGLVIDLAAQTCQVIGKGYLHLVQPDGEKAYPEGSLVALRELGDYHPLGDLSQGIAPDRWQALVETHRRLRSERERAGLAPPEVWELVERRHKARLAQDWAESDRLRGQIAALGWKLQDTPDGPRLERA